MLFQSHWLINQQPLAFCYSHEHNIYLHQYQKQYILIEIHQYQNNKKYDLFGFIKPDFENYIVFELISNTSSSVKNFYSVDITLKDKLKLGRGQEAARRNTFPARDRSSLSGHVEFANA